MSTTTAVSSPPPSTSGVSTGSRLNTLPTPVRVGLRSVATLWSDRKARVGMLLLLFMILIAVLAPVIAPYSPHDTSFVPYQTSRSAHWLGTTGNGEDAFSQLLYGARVTLMVGLVAGALAILVAVVVGIVSGYRPGAVDGVLQFLTNLALVIPAIPLMIILAAYLPSRSVWTIVLVITITGWAAGARIIRSQAATLRERDFVTSAAFSGDRLPRIVFREILPNMTSLVASSFFGAAMGAVLGEASLEFLGLGNPQTVSWGTMLYWAQNNSALLTGQWQQIAAPGLAIALLMLAMLLINFGVDSLSNPRLREKA